jgi:diguanylate cyclase (GGDEF)-like protein
LVCFGTVARVVGRARVVSFSPWFEGRVLKLKLFVTWSSRVGAILVCFLGTGMLLGWIGAWPAASGEAGRERISALGLLFGGLSLVLVHAERFRWLERAAASSVLAVGIGEALRDAPQSNGTTSFSLALVGVALLLLSGNRRARTAAQVLVLPAALFPAVRLAEYAYGVREVARDAGTASAFPTALGCFVLALAVLHAKPAEGLIRIFTADTSGGIIARWMTPASLLFPILLGSIFVEDRFNFGQLRLGIVFIVLANGFLSMTFVWTLAFFLDRQERAKDDAQEDAEKDSLTGVGSRRFFEVRMREEIKRNARFKGFFSLILFDIDHFKKLNDTCGHMVGDTVLETVGRVVLSALREIDVVCRFGGEEFAVIAPLTRAENAIFLADRIRLGMAATRFSGFDGRVTISAGISEYPRQATTRDALVARADAALYAAKQKGRNCVVHARSI